MKMDDNNRFNPAIFKFVIGAALLTAPPGGALADDYAGQNVRTLEEIIVTARKREESLQDSPVTISAISKQMIDNFQVDSLTDIASFTPGLVASKEGNAAGGTLFMRGIGSGSGSPSIDQAVSLVVDDTQIGSLQLLNASLIDMTSVQAYKGPQALFFGKNSPGGVLAIRTAGPGDEFETQIKTGYEVEAEEWFVQGIVSGPMTDTVAGRLVVRYTDSEGYFDVNPGNNTSSFDKMVGTETLFARGTLLFDPSDDLQISAKLTYNNADGDVGGSTVLQRTDCPLGDPQLIFPVPISQTFSCDGDRTIETSDIPQAAIDALTLNGYSIGPGGAFENEQIQTTIAIDYDISDELSLASITGYYDVSHYNPFSVVIGTGHTTLVSTQVMDIEQVTQELRLASSFASPVNFVGGLFYEDKTHENATPLLGDFAIVAPALGLPIGTYGLLALPAYELESEAYSAFLDLAWDITDSLELSSGARYSYEEKTFTSISGFVGEETQDWDDISPQLTLSYTTNEDWLLYASYREGFKSGGFDGAFTSLPGALPHIYNPEEVDGFEFGAKGSLFDDTLQVNAVVYAYDYDDLQLSRFDATQLAVVTVNAAAAEIQGVELDFVWLTPVEGLTVRGAIAYNDTEFKDYIADCFAGQTPAQGCDDRLVGGVHTGQDVSGESLLYAPEWVISLGLSHEVTLGGLVLGTHLDALFSDEYLANTDLKAGAEQDSYTKIDASLRLSDVNGGWSVALIGRNLTDEFLKSGGATVPLTGSGTGTAAGVPGDTMHYIAPGQTLAVEFEYNFR